MKKIYLSILASAFAMTVNAQLTLTKAFNEPVVGNVNTQKGYDSTGVIPKATGAGQNWNFSTLTTNTVTEVTTFTTVASTPSAALFPTATIVEDDGSGQYTYWRTTASNYELLGFADGAGNAVTFTNSAIAAVWPVAFGYNNTDAYAGSGSLSTLSGPATGTITTTAPGSGTVTLPGSLVFTNCLQVRTVNRLNMVLGTAPLAFTVDVVGTSYSYYHGTQKFPLIEVNYEKQTINALSGPTVTTSANIRINNAVLTGINDLNIEALNYNVYPNPATDLVNIHLTNSNSENVSIEVINAFGQTVKSVDLGTAIEVKHALNTADLPAGMYHIKTSIGENSHTKKLIIK